MRDAGYESDLGVASKLGYSLISRVKVGGCAMDSIAGGLTPGNRARFYKQVFFVILLPAHRSGGPPSWLIIVADGSSGQESTRNADAGNTQRSA